MCRRSSSTSPRASPSSRASDDTDRGSLVSSSWRWRRSVTDVLCHNRAVRYLECAPIPELRGSVERVWTLEGRADPADAPQPVLPDGRPELVLHVGEPFELVRDGGAPRRQPAIIFAGQLPSQLLLRPMGRVAIVGVRFHPHGAAALLREPQHRLSGTPMSLDDLRPELSRDVSACGETTGDLRSVAQAVQGALVRALRPHAFDPRVAHAVDLISRSGGRLSIDRVAALTAVTRRHLERRFLDHVGVTPKRLARITRFQRALRMLEHDGGATGAETAAACGYADQAHFTRDFRSLAGCAPSEHLLQRAELTGFFIASSASCASPSSPVRH